MEHEREFLSERDSTLLARELRIGDPTGLPDLIDHLPEGVALRTILFQYDATPPGGKKAGHKEHIPCAFGHGVKHWKGYGIELENGQRALIGKDCGKKHFGLDFQSFENSFRAEATRQYELRRLIALREAMPAALAELAALASHAAVIGYDEYWNAMRRHFGKMSQALAKSVRSSQGRLMTIEMVRDAEAEEAAARRLAAERADAIDEPSLFDRMELAATADERRIAIARWRSFLNAQPPIWMPKPLDMGPCDSWTLLNAAERSTPKALIAEARAIAEVHGRNILARTSDEWSKKELAAMRRGLGDVFGELDSALTLTKEILAFTAAANIQRIAEWAQEFEQMENKLHQVVIAHGRALVDEDNGARLELSADYRVSATPRLDALREIMTGEEVD